MKESEFSAFKMWVEKIKSASNKEMYNLQNIEKVYDILQKQELMCLSLDDCKMLLIHNFARNKAKQLFPNQGVASVLTEVYDLLDELRCKYEIAHLFSFFFVSARAFVVVPYRIQYRVKNTPERKSALNSLCDLIYKEDFAPECVEDSKFPLALYTLTFAAQCIVMVEFCYFLRQAKNMWFDKC